MIEQIITKEQYDQLAKEGSIMLERRPLARKGVNFYGDGPGNFHAGCGISAGATRKFRWKDTPKRGKARVRGGIVVTALSVSYCMTTGKWEVTFIKQMESVPTLYLQRGMGYTTNASRAVDDGGQVPWDESVATALEDERVAMIDKRRRESKKNPPKEPVEPQEESTLSEEEIDALAASLRDELAA